VNNNVFKGLMCVATGLMLSASIQAQESSDVQQNFTSRANVIVVVPAAASTPQEPLLTMNADQLNALLGEENADMLTRKFGKKLFFAGLAQACGDVGQIVSAKNKKEKQQGMLSLFGTCFQVASELSDKQKQQPAPAPQIIYIQQPAPVVPVQPVQQQVAPAPQQVILPVQPAQPVQPTTPEPTPQPQTPVVQSPTTEDAITKSLIDLTDLLVQETEISDPESLTRTVSPLVDEVRSIGGFAGKMAWFKKLLASPEQNKQFFQELFALFYKFLCARISVMTDQKETNLPLSTPVAPVTQLVQQQNGK